LGPQKYTSAVTINSFKLRLSLNFPNRHIYYFLQFNIWQTASKKAKWQPRFRKMRCGEKVCHEKNIKILLKISDTKTERWTWKVVKIFQLFSRNIISNRLKVLTKITYSYLNYLIEIRTFLWLPINVVNINPNRKTTDIM